jgi:hypothetical protein
VSRRRASRRYMDRSATPVRTDDNSTSGP